MLLSALSPAALTGQARLTAPGDEICPPATPAAKTPLDDVRWLADDALEGREAGSAGERCAAAYLAARFGELGLEPAGPDGGWYQPFPVRAGSVLGSSNVLAISGEPEALGKVWTPYGFSGSAAVRGRLAYAGSGISAPGTLEDRFAHLNLEGAVAVIEAEAQGLSRLQADAHFRATVASGRRAAALVVLLPDGRPLPDLDGENRPVVPIPVLAVAGALAQEVREAAQEGSTVIRLLTEVRPRAVDAYNVVARLPGTDAAADVVLMGAHFDHLGHGGEGSLAPDSREIHNGADDNASGAAGLLEIARRLREGPRPRGSVIFVAFGGEERGLLGSTHYVENPTVPLDRTRAMLNLDMVGRLEERPLTVFGMATAPEWEELVREANARVAAPLPLSLLLDGFGPSDHAAFWARGVPVLHFFTGTHEDYHRPSDDWERVDERGLSRVAALSAEVAMAVVGSTSVPAVALTAATPEPTPHGAASPTQPSSGGYGPYFGSIPDMTPQDFGVRITGVREDSPAQRAGLRGGDVIVSFGGKDVTDLYAFTYALQEHQSGDRVEVVVMREGEKVIMAATLAERR